MRPQSSRGWGTNAVRLVPKPLLATPRRSRRRVGLALLAISTVALAIGIAVVGLPGSSRGASPAAKTGGATTVQRRDLIATDTVSGTLTYADPQTVYNRLTGTVTWLPKVGRLIKPGHTLYKVDDRPVVLFNGSVPAYRDLSDGVSDGPDVRELEQNLRDLGFDPNHDVAIDDTFDSATAAAVERWQASVGESQTGRVALGQIVFLAGAQRVTSVDTGLGSSGGSSGSEFGSGSALRGGSSAGGAGGGGSGAGAGGSGSGSGGGSAQPILQTTSAKRVVSVDLDATKQTEAVVGEPVTVELPDGRTVDGKITEVSPVAQTSSNSGSESGSASGGSSGQPSAAIPVTIRPTGRKKITGLDRAAVSVNFEKQKATGVLSVPVTALLATAGGGYAVQEAAPSHRLIPVTPGLFAAGYVQISGAQVHVGLRVTDSQG
jgi:hypothetical protein